MISGSQTAHFSMSCVLCGFSSAHAPWFSRRHTQTFLSGRPAYRAQALAMAGRHDRTKTTCPFGEKQKIACSRWKRDGWFSFDAVSRQTKKVLLCGLWELERQRARDLLSV